MKRERRAAPAAVPHEDWLLEQLKDAGFAADYLNAALDEGDQAAFMLALRDVARARGGVTAIARRIGMNRVALARALSEKGNPELRSLTRILGAAGVRLQFVAPKAGRRERAAGKSVAPRVRLRGSAHGLARPSPGRAV
jgi:probable addiction module antidote protein